MVASLHPHACPAEEVLELTDITEVGGSDTLSKSGAHSGGLAASAVLTRQFPACRSLILTTFGPPGFLRRAMDASAYGFVVKDAPAEQVTDAIRRVASGLRVVDPALAAETLVHGPSPLTPRERDVLVAARDSATVAEIAGRLFLSEGTVRNYLSAAIAKSGARNRIEAARIADGNGWL